MKQDKEQNKEKETPHCNCPKPEKQGKRCNVCGGKIEGESK